MDDITRKIIEDRMKEIDGEKRKVIDSMISILENMPLKHLVASCASIKDDKDRNEVCSSIITPVLLGIVDGDIDKTLALVNHIKEDVVNFEKMLYMGDKNG